MSLRIDASIQVSFMTKAYTAWEHGIRGRTRRISTPP